MLIRVEYYNDGIEDNKFFDDMETALSKYNELVETGEYEYVELVIVVKEHSVQYHEEV